MHLQYMQNGITFCCHPNFKSNGEWYDWVMVQFNNGTNKVSCGKKSIGMWSDNYFPSKVLCFFVILGDDTTYAIIHSCNVNDHESDSILFERWELENTSGTLKMVNGLLIDIFMSLMLIKCFCGEIGFHEDVN